MHEADDEDVPQQEEDVEEGFHGGMLLCSMLCSWLA